MPGISAVACDVPTAIAWRQVSRAMRSSLRATSSPNTGARARSRSKPSRSRPLTIRKAAAEEADAKSERSGCSSRSPRMPAGIVPTTSSQPRRASASWGAISRSRSERSRPAMIRRQSSKKIPMSTIAVARWVATRKVRK